MGRIQPITSREEYLQVLRGRQLVAAPLDDIPKLPPGAVPAKARASLRVFLSELDAALTAYEQRTQPSQSPIT